MWMLKFFDFRPGSGRARLLRFEEFQELLDELSAGTVNPSMMPTVLQSFVQPRDDVRYVTTFVNGGASGTSFHTFQSQFSARYRPRPGAMSEIPLPPLLVSPSEVALGKTGETPEPQVKGDGDVPASSARTDQLAPSVEDSVKRQLAALTSRIVK